MVYQSLELLSFAQTFSQLSDYLGDLKNNIVKISPFRVQSQIMPENEKEKLVKLYEKIKLDNKLSSDLIIMNKSSKKNYFNIRGQKFRLVYSGEVYDIYQINWLFFIITIIQKLNFYS